MVEKSLMEYKTIIQTQIEKNALPPLPKSGDSSLSAIEALYANIMTDKANENICVFVELLGAMMMPNT